jgi:hypothetical protein
MADPVKKIAVPIDMLGLAIRHLANPVAADDAANKGYADTVAALARTNAVADIAAQRGIANGYAALDVDGKLPIAQLPALVITDTFVVGNQVDMLALTAERGDVAIRTDLQKSFILAVDGPNNLAHWRELLSSGYVLSVNGLTGAVVLSWQADIGDGAQNSFLLTHGMGTRDVQVAVLDAADEYTDVECQVSRPSINEVRVAFGTPAPALNAYRVVVQR